MNYKLPVKNISASLIMQIVERCSHNNADINSLIQYTGKTKPYVTSAIEAGYLLNMLKIEENGTWSAVKDCAEILINPSSKDIKLNIFTKWLQMWNPFVLFLKYIKNGDNINVAARKLCSFYSFNKNHGEVSELFFIWAKNCKLLNKKGELTISIQLKEQGDLLNITSEDLIDDIQARMYLVEILGDDVFDWLLSDEIQELVNGLLKYKQHPYDAVNAIGRALEDFLKRIYVDLLGFDSQNLRRKNGISELGNYFYSQKLIHYKQYQIIMAQGNIRNMGSHGKEVESMEKWDISSTGALSQLFSTLALIKSLFHYVEYDEFLF